MFKELLKELSESNKVLVTGSYARGEQTECSDIDFQIRTPKECILYGSRNKNIDYIIELLDRNDIKWNSTRNGYISTVGEENGAITPLEFYDDFHRSKNKLQEVEILGIKFKTY
jgi:predicted nucleotidyltransferase